MRHSDVETDPQIVPSTPFEHAYARLDQQFNGDLALIGKNLMLYAGVVTGSTPTDIITGHDTTEPLLDQPVQLTGVGILENMHKLTGRGRTTAFDWIVNNMFLRTNWHPSQVFARLPHIIDYKKRVFVDGKPLGREQRRDVMMFDRRFSIHALETFTRITDPWFTKGIHIPYEEIDPELARRYLEVITTGTALSKLTDDALLAADRDEVIKRTKMRILEKQREETPDQPSMSYTDWMQLELEYLRHSWQTERQLGFQGLLRVLAPGMNSFDDDMLAQKV